MRDLKFRAWDKEEKVMREVVQINFTEEKVWCRQYYLNDWKFSEVELMQYTGLKDKNGVEIYIDDIIEVYDYKSNAVLLTAKVGQAESGLYCSVGDGLEIGILANLDRIKAIGNVHQNPELLNEQ